MKDKLNTSKIVIIFLLLYTINCNGQHAVEIRDTNVENVILDSNDLIVNNMIKHLSLRNTALKNNDIKACYNYSHPSELNETFEAFEKESLIHVKATKKDKLSIKNFEILKVGKMYHCNSEYQIIINLKTTMIMDKDEFSFERKIIALSSDGNLWKFINGGENDLITIKKLYPVVCISE